MRKALSLLLVLVFAIGILNVSAEEATEVAVEEATDVAVEEATDVAVEEATDVAVEEATDVAVEEATEAVSVAPVEAVISSVYVDGSLPALWVNAYSFNEVIYLPAAATANLIDAKVNMIDYYSAPATILTKGESCGYFFNNSVYAIINSEALDMEHPTKVIGGILYLPADIFVSLFGIEYSVSEENGVTHVDIKTKAVTVSENPNAEKFESIVKERKLTSDTNYLIWVSKANYSVRLFTKDNSGNWRFDREYPCAIGKPSSPTCEGTFKYYEKIQRWPYANYYVGPVMRFNRGYALHSTLVRYNGTAYDDRVGVQISAGCVRMHQADIQYLWDTVPLQTTVYVSAD